MSATYIPSCSPSMSDSFSPPWPYSFSPLSTYHTYQSLPDNIWSIFQGLSQLPSPPWSIFLNPSRELTLISSNGISLTHSLPNSVARMEMFHNRLKVPIYIQCLPISMVQILPPQSSSSYRSNVTEHRVVKRYATENDYIVFLPYRYNRCTWSQEHRQQYSKTTKN